MKKLFSFVLVAAVIGLGMVSAGGCKTGAERTAYTAARSASVAVDAGMRTYYAIAAKKEAAADRVLADPSSTAKARGDALGVRSELLKRHGKISIALAKYQAVTNPLFERWLEIKQAKVDAAAAAKASGLPAPPEKDTSEELRLEDAVELAKTEVLAVLAALKTEK